MSRGPGARGPSDLPHVVIVGGGFAGLATARKLRRAPVRVTLVDRRNFHLFQPLLYQVATGGLSPANIASPLRRVVGRQKNCRVLLAEVTGVDAARRTVRLRDDELRYDVLVLATGATHNYFGHAGWERHAPGLKTVEEAIDIRARILFAFESAEREALRLEARPERPGPDPAVPASSETLREWLTFAVVGAGPTGVEMAGTLAEMSRFTLRRDFRAIDPAQARILLIEGGDRVLPGFDPVLSGRALGALRNLGVTVRTNAFVTAIDARGLTVKAGDEEERIHARTVVWAAGVAASPLGVALAGAGAELDRSGRVVVEPDLTVPGHPEVFVLGDLALYDHGEAGALPGIAPVALQQGAYAARVIAARARGADARGPFSYRDRGIMATIGRSRAVADAFGVKFWGLPAWLAWLFVHLLFLIEFENRVLVMLQWAWNYVTFGRSARLITGESRWEPVEGPADGGPAAAETADLGGPAAAETADLGGSDPGASAGAPRR
ncbi:MAG TPA: NAD(P)/FAD-dependent oxidoreductase [Longimicrobiales bacterium]|nr:NAD(P)/FAD-dependent oxidoreductase [Longimicrobiales bacterium]